MRQCCDVLPVVKIRGQLSGHYGVETPPLRAYGSQNYHRALVTLIMACYHRQRERNPHLVIKDTAFGTEVVTRVSEPLAFAQGE